LPTVDSEHYKISQVKKRIYQLDSKKAAIIKIKNRHGVPNRTNSLQASPLAVLLLEAAT